MKDENNKPSYDHSATGGQLNYSCNFNPGLKKLESKEPKPDLKSQRQAATEDIAKLAQAGPLPDHLKQPGQHTVTLPPGTTAEAAEALKAALATVPLEDLPASVSGVSVQQNSAAFTAAFMDHYLKSGLQDFVNNQGKFTALVANLRIAQQDVERLETMPQAHVARHKAKQTVKQIAAEIDAFLAQFKK